MAVGTAPGPVTMFTSSAWGIHDAQNPADKNPLPSGCGFYRIVLPFEQLKAHGWDVHWQAGEPPPEAGKYKLIAAERLDNPDVLGTWRRLRQRHRLVYEIDDDVWNVDTLNAQAYRVYSRWSVQDAVENCCAISDLVTVTTEPLAELIRTQTGQQNVKVIPNFIPASVLDIERPRREHVTIGWTGGISHSWDVAMIARPVRAVLDRDYSLRLHIVGSDYRPTLGHLHARWTDWEPSPHDYYKRIDFDIGLAPIAPSKFNESKSWLKAIEYGALGIPVIASDFGPYREYVVDGVTGFLVKTEKQWRDRIRELVADQALRETMGAKARELAAQHTIEEHWVKWAAAYQEVLT